MSAFVPVSVSVPNSSSSRWVWWAVSLLCLGCSAWAKPAPTSPSEKARLGFAVAQACEVELDDDLSAYGDCIGHAKDRLAHAKASRLTVLGLHFQAWLIADLAARQGATRAVVLRQRYKAALGQGLRRSGWRMEQLCEAKNLACESVQLRMQQKM